MIPYILIFYFARVHCDPQEGIEFHHFENHGTTEAYEEVMKKLRDTDDLKNLEEILSNEIESENVIEKEGMNTAQEPKYASNKGSGIATPLEVYQSHGYDPTDELYKPRSKEETSFNKLFDKYEKDGSGGNGANPAYIVDRDVEDNLQDLLLSGVISKAELSTTTPTSVRQAMIRPQPEKPTERIPSMDPYLRSPPLEKTPNVSESTKTPIDLKSPSFFSRYGLYDTLNEQCRCGRITADAKRRPWVVKIEVHTHDQSSKTCTGTLLNHRYVLTAAHCLCNRLERDRTFCKFKNQTIYEIYPTSLRQVDVFVGQTRHVATKIVVPEERMLSETRNHDIALIRIDPFVVLDGFEAEPICIEGLFQEKGRSNPGLIFVDNSVPSRCVTTDQLPKPRHTCKSECKMKPTPTSRSRFCRNFLTKALNGIINVTSEHEAFVVEDRVSNRTRVCFQSDPGRNGWCRVEHMDAMMDYSRRAGGDWGFCSDGCREEEAEKKEVAGKLEAPMKILSFDQCHHMDAFEQNSEFCAGSLRLARILHFVWKGGHRVDLLPAEKGDYLRFLGGVGSCLDSRDSGGPAFQWTTARSDGTTRAVQIGVDSRGLGCTAKDRPGIYTKVVERVKWIKEQIRDGGCQKYT